MNKVWHKIIILVFILLSGCKEVIIHDASEKDANKIIINLHQIGISAEKSQTVSGLWNVSTSKSESIKAIAYLENNRLQIKPANNSKKSNSAFSTIQDNHIANTKNLASELENSLSSINQILEARVHLNIPLADPIFGEKEKVQGSASVLLLTKENSKINVSDIQNLVAGAAGINANTVNVLISNNIETSSHQKDVLALEPPSNSKNIFFTTLGKYKFELFITITSAFLILLILKIFQVQRKRKIKTLLA
jgi:type III secretion protein J